MKIQAGSGRGTGRRGPGGKSPSAVRSAVHSAQLSPVVPSRFFSASSQEVALHRQRTVLLVIFSLVSCLPASPLHREAKYAPSPTFPPWLSSILVPDVGILANVLMAYVWPSVYSGNSRQIMTSNILNVI